MPSGYRKNFKNHAVMIPTFKGVDTGLTNITFGGFLMDKYICSQPSAKNEQGSGWYDVAHSGAPGSVPAISQPGVPVWDYISFPQAMIACANKGKGWFLTTDFMWASLAFLSKKLGTQPHGGNSNVNPPADATYTTETALLDTHLKAESPTYNRALTGTGPATWAHNGLASGVYDLNGLCWEWICQLMTTDGFPCVSANLNLTYEGSPFGRGTVSGTTTLTADGAGVNWKKSWETWLKYDAEEAAFTSDYMLLGMTSGATAVISQVVDSGSTGLLRIRRTSTTAFSDNEVIHSYSASATTKTVSGAANNGAGLIRITTSTAHGLTTGNLVTIKSVGGTTEANNTDANTAWAVTVYDTTNFDLDGSTFVNAWTSGGTVYKVTSVGGVAAANGTEIGEFAVTYLGYDGQTGAFTLGDTVTGLTTGHTGIVVSDSDSGDYGTLGLLSASGVFQNDEELQVGGATKAIANGTAQSCQCYIAETASTGTSYPITASTPTTLTLSGSPTNQVSTFWIYKIISRDMTAGMTTGNKILTLRDTDNDLNAFALPATSSAAGSAAYGTDGYYFNKSAARAVIRGGRFIHGAYAGVFALNVDAPSNSLDGIGFRAAKAI